MKVSDQILESVAVFLQEVVDCFVLFFGLVSGSGHKLFVLDEVLEDFFLGLDELCLVHILLKNQVVLISL